MLHSKPADMPELALVASAIVTLILHFTGAMPLPPEALGSALTLPVYQALMTAARWLGARRRTPAKRNRRKSDGA